MRIHSDGIGIPFFNYSFMFSTHKLRRFYTKYGLSKSIRKLEKNIETDILNIDRFFNVWHKNYKPLKTTTEGRISGIAGMTVNERLYVSGMTEIFERDIKINKEYAKNILRSLEVDEISIEEIIQNKK